MSAKKTPAHPHYPAWINDHTTADKAIIALHLARLMRDHTDVRVGPNRDDRPHFTHLVENNWAEGRGGNKDHVMSCRHRIKKYHRQIKRSPFYADVTNPDISRAQFMASLSDKLAAMRAERELYYHLKESEERTYGDW